MVKWAFMTDPDTGNVGLYDEPVATGDPADPEAGRNAPLNDPDGNLASLYWHIQCDNMEVLSDTVVTVTHATIPAGSSSSGGSGGGDYPQGGISLGSGFDYSVTPTDHTLLAHDVGSAPIVLVAVDDQIISPGHIVQVTAGGVARYVSPWVDATNVYLREYASRGTSSTTGFDEDYRVLVFRPQRPAEGNDPAQLLDFDPDTGLVKMGDGRWSSEYRYLQVVPGGTPFLLAMGRTLDLDNGAPRYVAADGNIFDTVPSSMVVTMRIGGGTISGSNAGTPGNYGGSWTGDEAIEVQAP